MQNSAIKSVRDTFNGRRRLRQWRNTHFGGLQAAKAHPLAMCRFRPNDGGTVSTNLNLKLAPVSGYMRSSAYVDVFQVFVPYQAIEKLRYPDQPDAGVTEMARRRLMAGEGIGLGATSAISEACNIHPLSVGDDDRVSATIRIAYNSAVNHIRKLIYHDADQITYDEGVIQPATLTASVLDRFNGVLDPERHIDGAINLTGDLPVKGIGRNGTGSIDDHNVPVKESDGEQEVYDDAASAWNGNDSDRIFIQLDSDGYPQVTVDLDGASELTLRDLVESQKLDGLIRGFAKIIKDDPVNGEEKVERALYNLSVDYDHNCQLMYRKVFELSAAHQRPTDGASINDVSAHFELNTRFTTLVPRSELGGQLVTIVMIKPVETLLDQPDPAQTEAWEVVNQIHDETQLDEVLLKRRDLESGLPPQDQDAPAFWVGHNSLKHNYATQGPNEAQIRDVETKSSMWVYPLPASVTPENVSYPADGIDMYPFFNWNGAHAEYTVSQVAAISTSLAKGPNAIERIQLFADDPTLVDEEA